VEVLQALAGQEQPGGLDGILVGDQDGPPARVGPAQFFDQRGHSAGRRLDRLGREGQVGGVVEIGLQLAREGGGQILPAHPRPAHAQPPLGEALVEDRGQAEAAADDAGGLLRTQQGGAEQEVGPGPGQVGGGGTSLAPAGRTETETGQIAVAQVIRVVDLAVANEEEAGQHRRECRERVR